MSSVIGKLPELPLGLEYQWVTEECELCPNCNGLLPRGQAKIRLSQRRKSVSYGRYFPRIDGFCLNCSINQFGQICAEYYNKAGQELNAKDDLEISDPNNPKIPQIEIQLEAIQMTMDKISNIVRVACDHPVEYIAEPVCDNFRDVIREGQDVQQNEEDDDIND